MPKKSSSSRRWLREHFSDPYVKQAKLAGFRSRAIFKLQEIQTRDKIFKSGMTIVDLGAAPGGWSEYVTKCIGPKGRVIALDLLPMDPLPSVEFIQGDFSDQMVVNDLLIRLSDAKVDWVISDMAPNLSGIESVDQPKSIELAELALDFALQVKASGFLTKVFQGAGFDEYLRNLKQYFKKVTIRKPKASRGRSAEVYILAKKSSS